MIRFLCLGSGSSGNAYLLRTDTTTLLIDAGLSIKNIRKELSTRTFDVDAIDAVFVTHDHADHIKAVGNLAVDHQKPIYATHAVHEGINRNYCVTHKLTEVHRRYVKKGETVEVGDFRITPFDVPHDSTDCVGYTVEAHGVTFSLITDCGTVTPSVAAAINAANYLVIEANHDEQMLAYGHYPAYLKGRIRGDHGHLSNKQCAEALAQNATPALKQVWLCHLSQDNNHPELARKTVDQVLRQYGIVVGADFGLEVLKRRTPSDIYELL